MELGLFNCMSSLNDPKVQLKILLKSSTTSNRKLYVHYQFVSYLSSILNPLINSHNIKNQFSKESDGEKARIKIGKYKGF